MSLTWLTLHDCLVSSSGIAQTWKQQRFSNQRLSKPSFTSSVRNYFQTIQHPSESASINLRTLNVNLLSDINQYPQVGIQLEQWYHFWYSRSAIDILTLKLNVRRLDSCKTSKRLHLASLFFIFTKKARGFSLTSHYQDLGDCTTFFTYTKLSELARLSSWKPTNTYLFLLGFKSLLQGRDYLSRQDCFDTSGISPTWGKYF